MNIEQDGDLSLGTYNLLYPERLDKEACLRDCEIDLALFSPDAQVAVWFARQCDAEVSFVAPGILVPVRGGGLYSYPSSRRGKINEDWVLKKDLEHIRLLNKKQAKLGGRKTSDKNAGEWMTGAPPNEVMVEVEGSTGKILKVKAIFGRDGCRPHWSNENGTMIWDPRAFSRWRHIEERKEQ